MLPTILYGLLSGSCGAVTWTAADILAMWRDGAADDARIAHGLCLTLPHGTAAAGVVVEVSGLPTAARLFPDVLVHHPAGTATMPDLVAAASALLAEAAPPEPPPGNQPVQMSLF